MKNGFVTGMNENKDILTDFSPIMAEFYASDFLDDRLFPGRILLYSFLEIV